MHELPTAVQEHAPVTWVVNDGALGWPRWTQRTALGGRVIATEFNQPIEFVAVAAGAGCWSRHVVEPQDLVPALEAARQANESGQLALVDVAVDALEHHPGFDEFHRLR